MKSIKSVVSIMFIILNDNTSIVSNKLVKILIIILIMNSFSTITNGVSALSSLTVSIDGVNSVNEGTEVNLTVTITTDNLTDVSYQLTSTVGDFQNTSKINDIVSINGTFQFDVVWIAPTDIPVVVSAEITVDVTAEGLSDSSTLTVTVNPVIKGLTVTLDVPLEVNQTDLVPVSVTVIDNVSLAPVEDVNLAILTEIGTFENGADLINLLTNNLGKATATLNLSQAILVSATQNVGLSVNAGKDKYDPASANATVLVHRVQLAEVSVAYTDLVIINGESVVITVDAKINGLPWVNATIQVEADGGFFPNGDSLYKTRTNSSGIAVIEWSTDGLPILTSDTVFKLEVKVISADFQIDKTSFEVTVKADLSNNLSLPEFSSNSDVPLALIPFIAGLIILRRRKY